MQHTRIFFWRYLAWGAILVLAFGPYVGLGLLVLAYWPILRSAKRTARRINQEVNRLVISRSHATQSPETEAAWRAWGATHRLERRGDALAIVQVPPTDD